MLATIEKIIPPFNKIKKGSFLANVAVLMTGSVISQAILIIASPILTRLYSPADFGIFGLYTSIVAILATIISWKYEVAIMLPKKDIDAKALLFLSIIIAVFMTTLSFILIFFLKDWFIKINPNLGAIIYIIPVGAFINGLIQTLTIWNNRNKCFNNVSLSRVSQTSITIPTQISTKVFNLFDMGLIWGSFAGLCMNFAVLSYKSVQTGIVNLKNISKKRIFFNAYKYKDFPKYQCFSSLINAFIDNIVILLMIYFYSSETVGFFTLTSRVLLIPAAFIGQSVREVYYQKASAIHANGDSIEEICKKTTFGLIKLYIIPTLILFFLSPIIFKVFFGSKWLIAGRYAQIMSLYIFTMLINVPAVCSGLILNLQKFVLIALTVYLLAIIAGISAGYYFFHSHYVSILIYSILGIIFNLVIIMYVFKQIRNKSI